MKRNGLFFLLWFGLAELAWCQLASSPSGGSANLAAPGPIGGTTPSTGAFTTLSVTTDFQFIADGGAVGSMLYNTGGAFLAIQGTALVPALKISGTGLGFSSASATSADIFLERDAANTLAQRNGAANQAFRIYGLYTDASNRHYGELAMSDTALTISTVTAGTGVDTLDIVLTPAGSGSVKIGSSLWVSDTNHTITISGNNFEINNAAASGVTRLYGTAGVVFRTSSVDPALTITQGGALQQQPPAGANYLGQTLFLTKETTDATVTELTRDGTAPSATTRFLVASGKSYLCDILILGRQSAGGNEAAYRRQVLIRNNAGTTSITSNQTFGTDFESNAAWDAAAAADDTNDSLQINVTGVAATTIRWSARIETTEITH